MTANDLVYVCSLPVLDVVSDGAYVAKITFDNTPSGDKIGAPVFYADGVSEGAAAKSVVYIESSDKFVPITDGKIIKNGLAAYLVFEVSGDEVVAASEFEAAAVKLSKPALVVKTEEVVPPAPVTSDDAEITRLRIAGYINDSNVLQRKAYLNDTVPTFTTSGDYWVMVVALKSDFPVDSWSATCGGTALTASATGTITRLSNTSARVNILKSSLIVESPVALTMHPANAAAGNYVTASGWNVSPTSTSYDTGVGSSSGGCSAGSAVLALAVLGAFIKSRKK